MVGVRSYRREQTSTTKKDEDDHEHEDEDDHEHENENENEYDHENERGPGLDKTPIHRRASPGCQDGIAVARPRVGLSLSDFLGSFQYRTHSAEAILQVLEVDAASAGAGFNGGGSGESCRLTHAHRLAHATATGVRVMSRAETAADYPQLFAVLRHERSVRHAIDAGFLIDVAPDRFLLACGILAVVLDGRAAQGDLVVKLTAAQAVLLGQPVFTIDASRLAHADVMGKPNDFRSLVSGHHVTEEILVNEGLPTPLDLCGGELLGVRRIGVADPHGDGGNTAFLHHRVGATILAWQRVAARLYRLGHLCHQHLLPALSLEAVEIHVGHAERGGQRLCRVDLTRLFVRYACKVAKVCVAAGVDESLAIYPQKASLGVNNNSRNPAVTRRLDATEPGVQEHLNARGKQQPVPHEFEPLGVVGHAGPSAVGVGPKEDVPREIECIDDAIRNAADDLARLVARGEEAVERIKDLRTGPAGKTVSLDEHHQSTRLGGSDRGAATGTPGPDDYDLGLADRRYV